MCAKVVEQCRCGRNSYRLTPLVGRKNNMLKLKGTTLYPPAINDVLDNTDYVLNYVVVVDNSEAGTDDVTVRVSLNEERRAARTTLATDEAVIAELKNRFRAHLRVAPRVEILPADVLSRIAFPPKSRKPVKFIDNRKK